MMHSSRRAFSLLELTMVVALFSVAMVLIFGSLSEGFRKWRVLDTRADTQRQMTRAWLWLKRDLEKANPQQIASKRVAAAGNGDVIWFLSADDSAESDSNRRFRRDIATGAPRWQRNIIYYLIRPAAYASVANGVGAALDPDPENDYYAAHKFLIRKVVDLPGDEVLLTSSQINAYTTAPLGYNLSVFSGEPGLESSKLVADHLLSFRAQVDGRSIDLDLRAVHLAQASKDLPLGAVSLKSGRYTHQEQLRVLMKN